jgi:CRP-like cAMP-binding protein
VARGNKSAAEALREVPLFACLNDKELRRIADLARKARFAPGEDIITEGHSSGPFFLITEGDALVIVGGKERGKLGPGDFFGEMSLLDGQPRSATIRAIGDVRAHAISSWDFLALLERNWSMTHKLLVDIAHRVRVLDENPCL